MVEALFALVLLLDGVATVAILRAATIPAPRKAAQLALAWLVPLLGALACLLILRSQRTEAGRDKPREFYENAGCGGGDH